MDSIFLIVLDVFGDSEFTRAEVVSQEEKWKLPDFCKPRLLTGVEVPCVAQCCRERLIVMLAELKQVVGRI